MIFHETDAFKKQFQRLPKLIKKKYRKKVKLLIDDFFYPSLHTKKYKGEKEIWEVRIDRRYRFLFKKEGKDIYLLSVGMHKEVLGI